MGPVGQHAGAALVHEYGSADLPIGDLIWTIGQLGDASMGVNDRQAVSLQVGILDRANPRRCSWIITLPLVLDHNPQSMITFMFIGTWEIY